MRVTLPLYMILWSCAVVNGQNIFQYDEQGRLIADSSEEIALIEWNNQNKIVRVVRTPGSTKPDLEFAYDALGNKIMRLVKPRNVSGVLPPENWKYTYYINQDKDNPIAAYESSFIKRSASQYTQTLAKDYQRLFFDHPIGMAKDEGTNAISRNFNAQVSPDGDFTNVTEDGLLVPPITSNISDTQGDKRFELISHHQNVLTVISDRKVNGDETVAQAEVTQAADYYPYGMIMADREALDLAYPFGFVSKQKEINEKGNAYDFGGRMYNSKLGRWMSIDPMQEAYPSASPYNYALDNPIALMDPDGNQVVTTKKFDQIFGKYFKALQKTKGFQTILKDYRYGKRFLFEVDDEKLLQYVAADGKNYDAFEMPFYKTEKDKKTKKEKRVALMGAVATFSLVKLVGVTTIDENGNQIEPKLKSYSGFYMAYLILHEAVHGLEDAELKLQDKRPDHSTFVKYQPLILQTLKEYVQQQKLDYKDEELEALSWFGLTNTPQFRNYLENQALKTKRRAGSSANTVSDEEITEAKLRHDKTIEKIKYYDRPKKSP